MWGRYSNTWITWHYEFKKKIIWKLGAFLYIKQSELKKSRHIPSHTHVILHSLSQTCHFMNDHTRCCLRYADGPASFSVECESTWGPTGKQQRRKKKKVRQGCLHPTPANLSLQKCFFFVHEQVSDMQTSTLSRNKYTKSPEKRCQGRSNSFS